MPPFTQNAIFPGNSGANRGAMHWTLSKSLRRTLAFIEFPSAADRKNGQQHFEHV
jgi:hypothetical protein